MSTTKVQENGGHVMVTINAGFGTISGEEIRLLELCRNAPSGAQLVVTISGKRPVKAAMTESVVRLQEVQTHE